MAVKAFIDESSAKNLLHLAQRKYWRAGRAVDGVSREEMIEALRLMANSLPSQEQREKIRTLLSRIDSMPKR